MARTTELPGFRVCEAIRPRYSACPPLSRRGAFTLVELLVVVAIIAMLIAILLPSLSRAKQQARAVKCQAHLRELGHGMIIYYNEWGNYPTHQWRLADGSRIRWFNAMADALAGFDVQACPSTPECEVGRNNSYGYNYKYMGSTRDNLRDDNPFRPYETFPVKHLRVPSKMIAFADCDGTGWKLEWAPEKPVGDHNPDRIGNHGYILDPTYIPLRSEQSYSGGELEPYAWHQHRSYLSDRHLGESRAIFADGHGEALDPYEAYEDNRLWNGLGFDPGCDPEAPDFELDPHVDYKYDPSSGQQWRY